MIICDVLTAWVSDDDGNRPEIADTYAIHKWQDVTGQPSENILPDPNLYIIRAWVDDTVFVQIETDRPDDILWSEPV